MDPTTAELPPMSTERETNDFEVFNVVRGMKNSDAKTAVERTQAILAWLASRNMIDLFLGNPFTYEPDPRDYDPAGIDLICADRFRPRDNPDDRWPLYDATPWGRLILENRQAILRKAEKGSTNWRWLGLSHTPAR